MGLSIDLYKVLSKAEVTKLKNKYNVISLIQPEQEIDDINLDFIEIRDLINCDNNIITFNQFKHLIMGEHFYYDNAPAFYLKIIYYI